MQEQQEQQDQLPLQPLQHLPQQRRAEQHGAQRAGETCGPVAMRSCQGEQLAMQLLVRAVGATQKQQQQPAQALLVVEAKNVLLHVVMLLLLCLLLIKAASLLCGCFLCHPRQCCLPLLLV